MPALHRAQRHYSSHEGRILSRGTWEAPDLARTPRRKSDTPAPLPRTFLFFLLRPTYVRQNAYLERSYIESLPLPLQRQPYPDGMHTRPCATRVGREEKWQAG